MWGCFGSGVGSRSGLCVFNVLEKSQCLGFSGKTRWLGLSWSVVESGCSDNLTRDIPVLVCGYH